MNRVRSMGDTPDQLAERLERLEGRLEALEIALGVLPSDQQPEMRALTAAQGARLLRVSEDYLDRLIDRGIIPAQGEGRHRRVLLADLLRHWHVRRAALQRLAELSEEYGLYDRDEDGREEDGREEDGVPDPGRP